MTRLETPRPYQIVGAQWLASKDQALLADDMGLGKSCQAIHASDLVGANNILVVCPACVRVNWEREFEKFSPMDRPSFVVFGRKDKVPLSGVVICSYDLLVGHAHTLKSTTWDVLILDEAHFLKERTADRTRAVYGRRSDIPGVASKAKHVWRLTGTPAPNNMSELFTHLKSAGLWSLQYWDFVFHFCTGYDSGYGFKIEGTKNLGELRQLLSGFMLRRKKEEVMKDLPPIRYESVVVERSRVELDPEFLDGLKRWGEVGFLEKLKADNDALRNALGVTSKFAERPNKDGLLLLESMAQSLTTLRRWIGAAKVPRMCDIIAEELEANAYDKIVIFAVHRVVIHESRIRLKKFKPVTLYGDTPPVKRQQNIDAFMNDPKCRVFIGNIQAAGTGITLTSAAEVAFFECDWVPSNNAQAAMRCHRIGQTRPVRVRFFSLYQSVDEQVQATLSRKLKEIVKVF